MIFDEAAERISFLGFLFSLIIACLSTIFIFISFINLNAVESVLPKAIVSIPLSWFLSLLFLSNAFKYANVQNQRIFYKIIVSNTYYILLGLTLSLFSIYTLYVYLLCNQKRSLFWLSILTFFYKLFALFPLLNFAVMYLILKRSEPLNKIIRLYLSFSLARYIYINCRTTTDIFDTDSLD